MWILPPLLKKFEYRLVEHLRSINVYKFYTINPNVYIDTPSLLLHYARTVECILINFSMTIVL